MRRLESDDTAVRSGFTLGIFTTSASDGVTSACVRYQPDADTFPPSERRTALDNRTRNETVQTLRVD